MKKRKNRKRVVILICLLAAAGFAVGALCFFSPNLTTNNDFDDVYSIEIKGIGKDIVIKGDEADGFFNMLMESHAWVNLLPECGCGYEGDASDYQVDVVYKDGTFDRIYVDEARNAAIRKMKPGHQPPIVKAKSGEIIEYILSIFNQ